MLTGLFDFQSTLNSPELDHIRRDMEIRRVVVQTCHIVGEATMQGIDPADSSGEGTVANKVCAVTERFSPPSFLSPVPTQTQSAANSMAFLRGFGLQSLVDELLAVDGVHNLGNLLSLTFDIHCIFDKLMLWFEGTDEVRCW